jgi:hypothetical protein
MTQQEWLQATDPRPMLAFLQGKASERKMRLFLVTCARLVWDRMADPTMRKAVEVAERYTEGRASAEELGASHGEIYYLVCGGRLTERARTMGVSFDTYISLHGLSLSCGFLKAGLEKIARMASWWNGTKLTGHYQPFILREIFGNPFRPITVNPTWLSWHGGLLVSMAQKMYDSRDFTGLPILADALEKAGCDDTDILGHCRGPGPHVRGCWVVDLLLGKE